MLNAVTRKQSLLNGAATAVWGHPRAVRQLGGRAILSCNTERLGTDQALRSLFRPHTECAFNPTSERVIHEARVVDLRPSHRLADTSGERPTLVRALEVPLSGGPRQRLANYILGPHE